MKINFNIGNWNFKLSILNTGYIDIWQTTNGYGDKIVYRVYNDKTRPSHLLNVTPEEQWNESKKGKLPHELLRR